MKKIFAILAVVMFAVAANAEVLFQETFATRRGSTYIVKAKTSSGEAWPYASQWFTGYEAVNASDNVTGNQYDNDYTTVTSYGVSVRGKKLNGTNGSSVGLYFAAGKAAAQDYVKFEGALPEVPAAGAFLIFDVCSTEASGGDLATMAIKVNEAELEIPTTTLGAQYYTSTISLPLAAGQVDSVKFSFNNVPSQKFIPNFKISTEAQGFESIVLTEKAQKVMVDGVVYVIRDGKMYNAVGTQVR